jgi:UDP-N-acetylglucosamine diphosphorylase/glucosamine-1-phosphate N-acetyltransferase
VSALILYEDRLWRSLRPLTDLLPVPALAFGASTLAERWRDQVGAKWLVVEARALPLRAWHAAPAAAGSRPAAADEVLVANAAALPGPWLEAARAQRSPALWLGEGRVAGARLPFSMIEPGVGRGEDFEAFLLGLGLPGLPVDAQFIQWPWNFIEWNANAIVADRASVAGALRGAVDPRAVLLEPSRIVVEEGARVDALAVLDARGGPVWIRRNAVVLAQTVVYGPVVVGEGTQLLGGFIGRSTIGPECRIAGEVDECVWQGYGNKRHHGFVGHSVIGEWANLGALTTTSDLKNNYGPVRVWVDGRDVDSGLPKVGAFVGAAVKTGIGTLLPTGASVGTGSNLVGGGRYAPKHVAPFAWWDGERTVDYQLDKFLDTARIAMGRRARTLSPQDEANLRACFDATARERAGAAGG